MDLLIVNNDEKLWMNPDKILLGFDCDNITLMK